jgi:hypothetical protein
MSTRACTLWRAFPQPNARAHSRSPASRASATPAWALSATRRTGRATSDQRSTTGPSAQRHSGSARTGRRYGALGDRVRDQPELVELDLHLRTGIAIGNPAGPAGTPETQLRQREPVHARGGGGCASPRWLLRRWRRFAPGIGPVRGHRLKWRTARLCTPSDSTKAWAACCPCDSARYQLVRVRIGG